MEASCPKKGPYVVEETAGQKWWCACGRSAKQPYCDGSHAGTGISPLPGIIDKPKAVAWCGCKQTKKPPYCDGSHSKL